MENESRNTASLQIARIATNALQHELPFFPARELYFTSHDLANQSTARGQTPLLKVLSDSFYRLAEMSYSHPANRELRELFGGVIRDGFQLLSDQIFERTSYQHTMFLLGGLVCVTASNIDQHPSAFSLLTDTENFLKLPNRFVGELTIRGHSNATLTATFANLRYAFQEIDRLNTYNGKVSHADWQRIVMLFYANSTSFVDDPKQLAPFQQISQNIHHSHLAFASNPNFALLLKWVTEKQYVPYQSAAMYASIRYLMMLSQTMLD